MQQKYKIIYWVLAGVALFSIYLMATSFSQDEPAKNSTAASEAPKAAMADKVEVVHFHGTQQCVSCITVGKYALKTIQEKFPEEYASGQIAFKEVNAELPENQDIVMKFQARGSSLFVNVVTEGKENILEDVTVWRLVNSQEQFVDYFENKLKQLLGKS